MITPDNENELKRKLFQHDFKTPTRLSLESLPRYDSSDIMWSLDGHALKPNPNGQWVRYEDVLRLHRAVPRAH